MEIDNRITHWKQCIPPNSFKLLRENLALVTTIFDIQLPDDQLIQDVTAFLRLYKGVFEYSSKDETPQNDENCEDKLARKFCTVYRKKWRGVLYLSSEVLRKVHKDTFVTIRDHFEHLGDSVNYRDELSKWQRWLDGVNDFRKKTIVDSITADTFEAMEKRVREQFPFDDADNEASTQFYDPVELTTIFHNFLKDALEDFKKEIPFEEDALFFSPINKELFDDIENNLKIPLVVRNSRNLENARKCMTSIVDELSMKYVAETECLKTSPFVHPSVVASLNKSVTAGCIADFDGREKPGNVNFQTEFRITLEDKLCNNFEEVLKWIHVATVEKIKSCSNQGWKQLESCLTEVEGMFDQHTAWKYLGGFRNIVEEGFVKAIGNLENSTLASLTRIQELSAGNVRTRQVTGEQDDERKPNGNVIPATTNSSGHLLLQGTETLPVSDPQALKISKSTSERLGTTDVGSSWVSATRRKPKINRVVNVPKCIPAFTNGS